MPKWLRRSLPDHSALIPLVDQIDDAPEWQEAVSSPYYPTWRESPLDVERVRGAVAYRIIRRLRDLDIRDLIAAGDPYWTRVAVRVVATDMRWHQSTRIQLSAMRSLCRCLRSGRLDEGTRQDASATIELALIRSVDSGVGEEFQALTRVARALASPSLEAKLRKRAGEAPQLSIRINAQRMLDVVEGKPYRRYIDAKAQQ